jgi:hypothetical protein
VRATNKELAAPVTAVNLVENASNWLLADDTSKLCRDFPTLSPLARCALDIGGMVIDEESGQRV